MTATTASGSNQAAPSTRRIDVVLVDDHAILRQGLRSVLEREPDIRVRGEAATPPEALAVVASTRCPTRRSASQTISIILVSTRRRAKSIPASSSCSAISIGSPHR